MRYKIWYKDKFTGEVKTKIEDTPESKEKLLQHAHVVKVQGVLNKEKKVIKAKKKSK